VITARGNESDMQKIFEIAVKPLIDYFKIRHLVVFQIDPLGTEWKTVYASGFSKDSIPNLQELKDTADFFKRIVDKRIPQMVNDIAETERGLFPLVEAEKVNSLIAVPLCSKENLCGILIAFSLEKSRFNQEDARIIALFGHQIGEMMEFFSQQLGENTDELLVQILGTLELLNFRYKNREVVPTAEILSANERFKNRILSSLASMEPCYLNRTLKQEMPKKESIKLPRGEELNIEEVITIQGKKNNPSNVKNVLIIDDEPLIAELLTSILERINIKCKVASYGQAGLELFDKEVFDLVITDLGMPDISGWDMSKAVKERTPEVPVIIITGWGLDPDPNKMKDSKVDQIITKPFQIDQLEKTIKDLLEK
jgi:CheY-like chemotaxis protein